MLLNARHLLSLAGIVILSMVANLAQGAQPVPSSGVEAKEAYADAQYLASFHADAKVMSVGGSSMNPYFADGAFIVVRSIQAEALKEGMIAVYRNRLGETVAHRLVARSGDAWVAKGYNNAVADSTLVDGGNLMGVVYAAVHSEAKSGARFAMAAGIPVALAAEAR